MKVLTYNILMLYSYILTTYEKFVIFCSKMTFENENLLID